METIVQRIKSTFPQLDLLKDLSFVLIDNFRDYDQFQKVYYLGNVTGTYLDVEKYIVYDGVELPLTLKEGEYQLDFSFLDLLVDKAGLPTKLKGDKDWKIRMKIKLNREIQQGKQEIYQKRIQRTFNYQPYNYGDGPSNYVIYMIYLPTQEVIGDYSGIIKNTPEGRLSSKSVIEIRPDFQGKGLCKVLASVTYCALVSLLEVTQIYLFIHSKIPRYACACYIKAAEICGLQVYIIHSNEKVTVDFCFGDDFRMKGEELILVVSGM